MEENTKKLSKILSILLIPAVFFFIVTDTITRYTAGGIASNYGFPFTYYYEYWFAPGTEFECPILWVVNLVLFCLFFMILGVLYQLIKEKKKEWRIIYIKIISIMIFFLVVFSATGFLICSFPNLHDLPEPGEYVYGSDVKFLENKTEKTLMVASIGGHKNLKWNETTITVSGNQLIWNNTSKTWKYENIEIVHYSLSENDIDTIDLTDYIANCTGKVTITYNPNGETFGTWDFS